MLLIRRTLFKKRGRGAANKTPVFGMLKRDGRVYTQIVKNCSANKLIPILSQYSKLDSSTIYSDAGKLTMVWLIMELKLIIG